MNQVRLIRIEVGVKQYELAKELGLCQTNFSKIESGNYTPKRIEAIKKDAIKFLKPHLVNKLLNAQSEVEKLESLLIQIN